MKKQFFVRPFLNATLLLSSLVLLSGCTDWVKDKMGGCSTCADHSDSGKGTSAGDMQAGAQKATGEVLLTIDGKPAITMSQFDEYLNNFKKQDPQIEALLQFMPTAKQEIFKQQVSEHLIDRDFKDKKLDQNPEMQEKLRHAADLATRRVKLEWFQDLVLKSIDTSDSAIEKFYNDNKATNPAFKRPPFIKSAEGIKARAVQFSDEKSAKEFAEKAQKPGADFVALAKTEKKEAKDLGVVNANSNNVDKAVRDKVIGMKPNEIAVVSAGKNKVFVVKTGEKQAEQFAPFEEVKDAAKQAMLELQFYEKANKQLEEIKEKYKAVENIAPFEKEREKQAAEFQEQLKKMQEEEAKAQNKQETPKEAAPVQAPQVAQAA